MPILHFSVSDIISATIDKIVGDHKAIPIRRNMTKAEVFEVNQLLKQLPRADVEVWKATIMGEREGNYPKQALLARLIELGLEHLPPDERQPKTQQKDEAALARVHAAQKKRGSPFAPDAVSYAGRPTFNQRLTARNTADSQPQNQPENPVGLHRRAI